MNRKSVEKSIWIENERGERQENAILGMPEGLWSNDHKRLTLLMDPGRVKTGLTASKALGLVFKVGVIYSLVVGHNAMSSSGQRVDIEFRTFYRT